MIPRDYEWFYKCNCLASFNQKENVTRKTHLLKSRLSLKRNCTAECSHPYKILEGAEERSHTYPQKFLASHHQDLSLFTSITTWEKTKLGGTQPFSSNGGNDDNRKHNSNHWNLFLLEHLTRKTSTF